MAIRDFSNVPDHLVPNWVRIRREQRRAVRASENKRMRERAAKRKRELETYCETLARSPFEEDWVAVTPEVVMSLAKSRTAYTRTYETILKLLKAGC